RLQAATAINTNEKADRTRTLPLVSCFLGLAELSGSFARGSPAPAILRTQLERSGRTFRGEPIVGDGNAHGKTPGKRVIEASEDAQRSAASRQRRRSTSHLVVPDARADVRDIGRASGRESVQ